MYAYSSFDISTTCFSVSFCLSPSPFFLRNILNKCKCNFWKPFSIPACCFFAPSSRLQRDIFLLCRIVHILQNHFRLFRYVRNPPQHNIKHIQNTQKQSSFSYKTSTGRSLGWVSNLIIIKYRSIKTIVFSWVEFVQKASLFPSNFFIEEQRSPKSFRRYLINCAISTNKEFLRWYE